jgi:hypothetical protein
MRSIVIYTLRRILLGDGIEGKEMGGTVPRKGELRGHFGDIGIGGRIILKRILKK